MANPQPRPFIRISQELFEALYQVDLTGGERRILDFVIRMTYGFRRKEVRLSRKDFIEGFEKVPGTKLSTRHFHRAVENLVNKNILLRTVENSSTYAIYSIQKNYDEWIEGYPQKKVTSKALFEGSDIGGTKKRHLGHEKVTSKALPYKRQTTDNKQTKLPVEKSKPVENLALIEKAYFENGQYSVSKLVKSMINQGVI